MYILDVILDMKARALDRVFSYTATEEEFRRIEEGMRVSVPFGKGNRVHTGVVVDFYEKDNTDIELKNIIGILDEESLIPEDLLQLSKFLRREYGSRRIDIIKLLLPPGNFSDVEKRVFVKERIFEREVNESEFEMLSVLNDNVGKYLPLEDLEKKFGFSFFKLAKDFSDRISIEVKLKIREERKVNLWAEKVGDIEIKKNAVRQFAVMECLKEPMSVENLREKTGASLETLRSLKNKGAIKIYEKEEELKKYPKLNLNSDQKRAFNEILYGKSQKYLLKGVTGSGKTEVYLHLTEEVLKAGKDIIFLVPEISLTPQMIDRFKGRFGNKIAILHSKLSFSERETQWRKIQNGDFSIVVGARSAIFAPVKNLGLIIIDEEHENSFKSQSGVRYDTVRVAEERSKISDAKLLLGSATPNISSFHRALNNEIKLVELNKRISGESLDKEIVDLREELKNGNPSIISVKLFEEIRDTLARKEQVILFINRKGFSNNLTCKDCGYTMKCDNCDVSMGYFKHGEKLKCNYCGAIKRVPKVCPDCGSARIGYYGLGTELVEDVIKKLFPLARVCRMDFESTRAKNSYETIYRNMIAGEIDILIGTQMVSKGLDFPKVSLVGVLLADTSLNFPDYKATERTFQLITQVSGRAGRAETKGRVIIQTFQPENYAVVFSKEGDYEGFAKNELQLRKEFFYPPFTRLLLVGFKGKNRETVRKTSIAFAKAVRDAAKNFVGKSFGPVPCFVEWINGKYRFQILYKTLPENFSLIREAVFGVYQSMEINGVDIIIDVDPINVI